MPEVRLPRLTIAYDVFGPPDGEPVVLVCGLSQPAGAWQLAMVPALTGAGYRVVTFDNRGVAPSSSPPAPYTIDEMVDDTVALLDHLDLATVRLAGYSMGGWIAETLAFRHPRRVGAAVFMGSCNVGTSWEKAITTVERDLALLDAPLPPLFNAVETMRYLPNHDLQNDETVDLWLSLIGGLEPWPNPGRLGQYEAALAWSTRRRAHATVAVAVNAVSGAGLRTRRRLSAGAGPPGGRHDPRLPGGGGGRGQPPRGVHPRRRGGEHRGGLLRR